MGVAYYPEFQHPIAGYDPSIAVSGKAVASAMDQLNEICAKLGVRDLMSFYSESLEESFAHIGERVPPGMKEQPIVWSEPEEGLKTITALSNYLGSDGGELADTHCVLDDLASLETVLKKAMDHQIRFRLRIDV